MLARGSRGVARDLHARYALWKAAAASLTSCLTCCVQAPTCVCDRAVPVCVRSSCACLSNGVQCTLCSHGMLFSSAAPRAVFLSCSKERTPASCGRWLRSFSAAPSAPAPEAAPRVHGGLKDEDRIFTNLYCQGDPFIKVSALLLRCVCLLALTCCAHA